MGNIDWLYTMSLFAALLSVITAWCLNSHRVTMGRRIGIAASLIWGTYGLLTEQYSIVIVDVVYLIIYAQAWRRFKSKQAGYGAMFDNQQDLIEHQANRIHELQDRLRAINKAIDTSDLGQEGEGVKIPERLSDVIKSSK